MLLGTRARIRSDAQQEVGRAKFSSNTQMGFNQLQVPQATSEPRAGGQTVLFDVCYKRKVEDSVSHTGIQQLSTTVPPDMHVWNGSHLDILPGRQGCWSQRRWIVDRGWGWCVFARLHSKSGHV